MAPFVAGRRAPSPNRATWPPSSPGPDTRTRVRGPSRELSPPIRSAVGPQGRARYTGGGRRFTAPDRNICGRTSGTRPAPTKETNKPTRPHHTHPSEQNGKRKKSERLSYPVLRLAVRALQGTGTGTGTGGSVVLATKRHGQRVQGPPSASRRRLRHRRRQPTAAAAGGAGGRHRTVRGQDVPHGERPGHGRRRALGRRQQHLPRPRPGHLLRLPAALLLQAPQLRQLRPAAQHLRVQEGGHGPVGVRARVVPPGPGAPAAAGRAQEEEGGRRRRLPGPVRGGGGDARNHPGRAAPAGGAAGDGERAAGHGPPPARRREPAGPDDGVPLQARGRTRRRAALYASQEGGAGRQRVAASARGGAGQKAADRGRGRRGRRRGPGAEPGRRAVPVLCSRPSVLLG